MDWSPALPQFGPQLCPHKGRENFLRQPRQKHRVGYRDQEKRLRLTLHHRTTTIESVPMKFGIRYCNTGRYVDPDQAVELVQAAETAGFESAWTVEHTIIPRSYESSYPYTKDGKIPGVREDTSLPDPQIWLAYVAARTTKINLATGILILPQHNPVICAKQVATLDHMSRGRVILGVGVGWLKEEFDALGVPFEERGARTDDYIRALRALWSQDIV